MGKERVNGGVDVFFVDWIDGYSIGRDPLIYREEGGFIPLGNLSHTQFTSFP